MRMPNVGIWLGFEEIWVDDLTLLIREFELTDFKEDDLSLRFNSVFGP